MDLGSAYVGSVLDSWCLYLPPLELGRIVLYKTAVESKRVCKCLAQQTLAITTHYHLIVITMTVITITTGVTSGHDHLLAQAQPLHGEQGGGCAWLSSSKALGPGLVLLPL